MRYGKVVAHAFGALQEQSLELAPGMSVIFGPNESGKSTWHAALFAGLCGMRRARGRPTAIDQRFIEHHKPWGGDSWLVSADVALADGRRIRLRHDLDGRSACSAVDLAFGRDCSGEIINDGNPDGSVWLGLDRRSFLATACVRQAELLAVTQDADALQVHMQRAAASSNAASTAAAAIDVISKFRSQRVGLDRSNATGPLRKAVLELQGAQQDFESARDQHKAYLGVLEEIEECSGAAERAEEELKLFRAKRAEMLRDALVSRFDRVRTLVARYPESPANATGDEALGQRVAGALAAWENLPTMPQLPAEGSDTLADGSVSTPKSGSVPTPSTAHPDGLATLVLVSAGVAALGGLALLLAQQLLAGVLLLAAAGAALVVRGLLRRQTGGGRLHSGQSDEGARAAQQWREHAQSSAREAADRWRNAEMQIRTVSGACNIVANDDASRATALREWIEVHNRERPSRGAALHDWAELQALLDGRRAADLAADVERATEEARRLASGLDQSRLQSYTFDEDQATHEERLEAAEREALAPLAEAKGRAEQQSTTMASVADAEERLQRAELELSRLRRLEQTLSRAQEFLESAQERVHHDIAPVLASAVRQFLPQVTGGRYVDAVVDPASLEVRICADDRILRLAGMTSYGTGEQVFLLLRVAMAQHLTTKGEVCPLILDDATVHCDHERKMAVLETLHTLSADRQVIVFTQEDSVRAWAEAALDTEHDRLVHLDHSGNGQSQGVASPASLQGAI